MKSKREIALEGAAIALVYAYKQGQLAGGSVDWSDVDAAHELAVKALKVNAARGRKPDRTGDALTAALNVLEALPGYMTHSTLTDLDVFKTTAAVKAARKGAA